MRRRRPTDRRRGRAWPGRLALAALAWVSTGDLLRRAPPLFDPEWPPQAPIDLPTELAATAAREAAARILARRTTRVDDAESSPLTLDAPGVQAREGSVEGLAYLETVLGDVEFDDPLPLVVVLHGYGGAPRVPGGPFFGVTAPMRIVMPRGPLEAGDGHAWAPVLARHGRPEALAAWLEEAAARVAYLIETLRETRPTLGAPIVSGFSQGGMVTFTLAVRHPEVVGVAMPLAGWLPPPLVPAALDPTRVYPPVRSMHGTADEAVRLGPTLDAIEALRARGLHVTLETFEGVGHEMSPAMNHRFRDWLGEALAWQAPPTRSVATVPDLLPGPAAPSPEAPAGAPAPPDDAGAGSPGDAGGPRDAGDFSMVTAD